MTPGYERYPGGFIYWRGLLPEPPKISEPTWWERNRRTVIAVVLAECGIVAYVSMHILARHL